MSKVKADRARSDANNAAPANSPAISVVLPAYNESGNLGPLIQEIDAALNGHRHEIIVVNDGSTDDTQDRLLALRADYPQLRVLAHRQNAGQSRAVRTGILAARAPVIATLDSDGQNDPADLPEMYAMLTAPDAPQTLALIGGVRAKRRDTAAKRLASKIGNGVRKRLLADDCDDTGCGIKVFRRDAFLLLPYFDHIHRYLPALMIREGFTNAYKTVNHRPRGEGESKYTNFGRLRVSINDLRGVRWLMSRSRNPQGWDELSEGD